jgi:predicted transcriptional regulator
MKQLMLSLAQQRRLVRLARIARRTPRAMLRFVLRDGFDVCESDVHENAAADAEFAAGESYSHKEVMRRARAVIATHARGHKQAA